MANHLETEGALQEIASELEKLRLSHDSTETQAEHSDPAITSIPFDFNQIFEEEGFSGLYQRLGYITNKGDLTALGELNSFLDTYSQSQTVLEQADPSSDHYWELRNLQTLTRVANNISNHEDSSLAALSGSGSYGPIFMGSLMRREEQLGGPNPENPPFDTLIGISGGALYPSLYSLFREAHLNHPEKIPFNLESLTSWTSFRDIEEPSSSMLLDETKILEEFEDTANRLIFTINIGRSERGEELLPAIDEMKFSDLSLDIVAVASRERPDGSHQRVLFGDDDLLLQSLLASSNPADIAGVQIPGVPDILREVVIEGEHFHDGVHTDPGKQIEAIGSSQEPFSSPVDNALLLSADEVKIYCALPIFCSTNDIELSDALDSISLESPLTGTDSLPFHLPLPGGGMMDSAASSRARTVASFLRLYLAGSLDQSVLSSGVRFDPSSAALNTAIGYFGANQLEEVRQFLENYSEKNPEIIPSGELSRLQEEMDTYFSIN